MLFSIRTAVTAATLFVVASSHAAVDAAKAKDLATKNACLGCHAVDVRMVGPAYREVAAKYQGMDPAKLAGSIRAGSAGKWGQLEMPAQTSLSEADARLLAEWVLSGGPDK